MERMCFNNEINNFFQVFFSFFTNKGQILKQGFIMANNNISGSDEQRMYKRQTACCSFVHQKLGKEWFYITTGWFFFFGLDYMTIM